MAQQFLVYQSMWALERRRPNYGEDEVNSLAELLSLCKDSLRGTF